MKRINKEKKRRREKEKNKKRKRKVPHLWINTRRA
jgi:hypothetical protein